jgi:hypothetical protein
MNRRISVNTGLAVPQSFITKGKQRLKQHVDTVYLNNGDEFEIELYNPTQNKVLAKIELNGNSIGSGIILRPGERVFLERYLNEAKKFLFETYTVNGNNEEVQRAIAENGDVTVKFYNETTPIYGTYGTGSTLTINNPNWNWSSTTNNPFTYTTHNTLGVSNFNPPGTNAYYTNTSLTSGTSSTSTFSTSNTLLKSNSTSPLRSLETGRVEKGSNSDQSFTYDNSSFYTSPFHTNWWKLKPQSTKPLVAEDLAVYCTECGAKRKKDNHKFCPHCGTKY